VKGDDRLHQVYLGLGSNMGQRQMLLEQAIRLIGERVGKVLRQSSFIETEPWGFESPNKFLNAVVRCETDMTPRQLLKTTQQIERDMGRKKKSRASLLAPRTLPSYADRPIDIDILLYDDITIDEPDLKIPHPLMHERDFVMTPLNEIQD